MKIELDVNLEQMIELKLAMEDKVYSIESRLEVCENIMDHTHILKLKKRLDECEKLLEKITNIYNKY